MRPDDLPRVKAHHSARADRERLEAAYQTEGTIILGCFALALFVVAVQTGAIGWCIRAMQAAMAGGAL